MDIAQPRIPITLLLAELVRALLSLHGRARRRHFLFLVMLSGLSGLPPLLLKAAGVGEPALSAILATGTALISYLWIAMLVRRLHDQGRSGWWALALYGIGALIMLGVALQPQQEYGLSFGFLFWTLHPVAGPMTMLLTVAFMAHLALLLAVSLLPPEHGANRFGPDPRKFGVLAA